MPHPCTNLRAICPKSCYILFHIVPVLSTFLLPDSSCISQWATTCPISISGQSYCPLCNKIVLWWALSLFRRQSPRVYCPLRNAERYIIPIRSTAATKCRKIPHTYQGVQPPRNAGRYHIPIRSIATMKCRKIHHTHKGVQLPRTQEDTAWVKNKPHNLP